MQKPDYQFTPEEIEARRLAYTAKEAATAFGIPVLHVQQAAARYALTSYRVGVRKLYLRDDLIAWLRTHPQPWDRRHKPKLKDYDHGTETEA